ncbi:hypothetical protein ACFPM7_18370 [Actinokineospora guangxiensis]|uniref:Uncharacterized protein n=1 Tax=Actinokineospora guangxiensis TaxID=1490288 RepID=A0ABW0ES64_9PSEU
MGWLRRNRRAPRTVTRGRGWPDAVLDAAVAEAEDGRLGAARTVLAECRDLPEIRAFRVGELAAALVGFGDGVATVAGVGDPDLLLLSGAVFSREAWTIRGSAAVVGATREKVFRGHAALAVAPLRAAARLLPHDPVPWAELEPVARGLGAARAERDDVWAEVARRCPTLTVAVKRRLTTLTPRWGGDEADMLAFAREAVAAAPEGHPAAAILAEAQFERAAHAEAPVAKYARPARAELSTASAKLLAGTRPMPQTAWAHNAFAAVFAAMGDAHAAPHLRAMNDHLDVAWDRVGGEPAYQRAVAKFL